MADFASRLKLRFKECGHFVHDKQNKTYCRKTGPSWAIVLSIYLTYFVCVLVAFLLGLRLIKTLVIQQDLLVQLCYDSNIYVNCSDPTINSKEKFCQFTKDMLGPCGKSGYGYPEGKPCIFLKLNKMRGWTPWEHVSTPDPLINEGEETEFSPKENTKSRILTPICKPLSSFGCDRIGLMAVYPKDKIPHFNANLNIIFRLMAVYLSPPKEAFQEYYFPFNGSDLYLSPLAAVQFLDILKGFVVGVTCEIVGITSLEEVQKMLRTTLYLYISTEDDV
ncbi:Sodium / potassium ATPase beta chain [Popillia japonica]|uniref:Sodium / potassium ATPase beta chain n=1 Tax=Popillia japonica TaxID=7064 RepID=A0AAW1JFA4_POPJA